MFQGVGHGMPQDREGARIDPNRVPHPPHTPNIPWVYPFVGPVIDDTQEALFDLVDTLIQHGTTIQGNVGQGVGTSKATPSHTQDPFTRSPNCTRATDRTGDAEGSKRHVIPHPCTMCGGICYRPSFESSGTMDYFDM